METKFSAVYIMHGSEWRLSSVLYHALVNVHARLTSSALLEDDIRVLTSVSSEGT